MSKLAPGDPVTLLGLTPDIQRMEHIDIEKMYRQQYQKLGLDKPIFYFTVQSYAFPDTLYKFTNKSKREILIKLINNFGNWTEIAAYQSNIENFIKKININFSKSQIKKLNRSCIDLIYTAKPNKIEEILLQIRQVIQKDSVLNILNSDYKILSKSYHSVINQSTKYKLFIPKISLHGFDNQFHNWISNMLVGDFGYSYTDRRPASDKIKDAIQQSLILNGIAFVLSFGLALFLGIYTAVHRGKKRDKWIMNILYALYALPAFWIGTLLIVFFTTDTYGEWLDLFPTYGLSSRLSNDPSFFIRAWDRIIHLVLPIFCLVYPPLAYLTKQMRESTINILSQEYIKTAKAKGLGNKKIMKKHIFKNAFYPMLTVLGITIPGIVLGSVVIEQIFTISGMGLLIIQSILNSDWLVVFAITWLYAIISLLIKLIIDIAYGLLDPRVNLKSSNI